MELLLLADEKTDDGVLYLYALEMVYQKIIKIAKPGTAKEISQNWRIGYITETNTVSRWPLEENTFVTSKDHLIRKHNNFLGMMLNKASFPDNVISLSSGQSYGIIRITEIRILDKGKQINFKVWGLNNRYSAVITDPWWMYYWREKYSFENAERYQEFLSAFKRKVFAIVKNKNSELSVLKIIVF